MKRIRLAVVTPGDPNAQPGGAERLFEGLTRALNFENVEAHHLPVPIREDSFESIQRAYLAFWDLDVSGYDAVISTKAPSYMVRHPRQVCYLVHTIRVFYDMFEAEMQNAGPEIISQRDFIRRMDTLAFQALPSHRLFCIGHTVQQRQQDHNGCRFEILHPPLLQDDFQYQLGNEDYAFLPGRLHRWKRVDLIIRAIKMCKSPMRLIIAGSGEDELALRKLAGDDKRIHFLGRISDNELIQFYSRARAVPFAPVREDYGYVTIEAFRSGKPVITCTDSGEPIQFVEEGETGFVCPPEPEALAARLDWLYSHPEEAAEMGRKGKQSVAHITWDSVRLKLLAALGY